MLDADSLLNSCASFSRGAGLAIDAGIRPKASVDACIMAALLSAQNALKAAPVARAQRRR
jgi:hypothetical protein